MIAIRLSLTALISLVAIAGMLYLWSVWFEDPWTRDARVYADVTRIASDVAGRIVELPVANNATVSKGDLLARIDPDSYRNALSQAQAELDVAIATRELRADTSDRLNEIQRTQQGIVPIEQVSQASLSLKGAQASVTAAKVAVASAELDLRRTRIVAPANGYVTNLRATIGDYMTPGQPALALVDTDSFRIDAFFMETKLPELEIGMKARIDLMGHRQVLQGEVRSIAGAIGDADNPTDAGLLQSPTPSFQWVRLPQRIPVEIAITDLPDGVVLVSGATASVIVEPARSRGIRSRMARLFD